MAKKLRLAVIGCGGIAERRTIPEGIVTCPDLVELVAVQDIIEERAQAVAAKYAVPFCFTEVEDLFTNCEVDAVHIATPTHLHHKQVLIAAGFGKHIFCEKPLGLTVQECEQMEEACTVNGVRLGLNFMMRNHACHQHLMKMISEDDLGTLVMGRAELTCWYPPIPGAFRQDPTLGGGGALIDMGNHCIDLLEQLFGTVREVSCFTGNLVQDYASEDTASVSLRFDSGATANVNTLFNLPDAAARNTLEVYGSKGCVYSYNTIGQGSEGSLNICLEGEAKEYDAGQERTEGGFVVYTPPAVNIYETAIRDFARAVLNETNPPVDVYDGIWSQKVIQACYESARTGKTVEVT